VPYASIPAPLKLCLGVLGPERVLFAADHPCEFTTEAVEFFDTLDLPPSHLAAILHSNAEAYCGLPTKHQGMGDRWIANELPGR
jgi:predicted TIM-barrel fold metal-dependent hydrolase